MFVCLSTIPFRCLSVRKEKFGSHWTNFHEILYLSTFGKSIEKIQISLKSDNNNRQFTFMVICRTVLLGKKNFSKMFVEKTKTHTWCSKTLFFSKIMPFMIYFGKNTVQSDRSQMTIWRMRFSSWIPKATDTHSEYIIRIAFLLPQWLKQLPSMLRYTYSTCSVTNEMENVFCAVQNQTLPTFFHVLSNILLHVIQSFDDWYFSCWQPK